MSFKNFDTFDPDQDAFDPSMSDNADGPQTRQRQISKAYFDLTLTNSSEHKQTVELFSALDSFTFRRKPELLPTSGPDYLNYTMHPLGTVQGNESQINNIVPVGNRTPANENTADFGYVGFDELGNLVLTGAGPVGVAGNLNISVNCKQTPYNGLFRSSAIVPFRITRIRMSVTTDAQIDNEIVHFTQNFLGAKSQNTVNPRNFFSPTQFQNRIIDIPTNFRIDGNRGLLYAINNAEVVTWNVEIEQYSFLTVGSIQ